jgi:hypothetical protein
MLTIPEYNEKFPHEKHVGSFQGHMGYPGLRFLSEGMLQFTEETACCWGGPYDGNYAHFILIDYTDATFGGGRDKGKKCLETWKNREKEIQSKIERGHYEYTKTVPYRYDDSPSLEKPIRLWMLGNDDTSYSKFYKTEQEALEELQLFIGNQPLDFHQVVNDFHFYFTN